MASGIHSCTRPRHPRSLYEKSLVPQTHPEPKPSMTPLLKAHLYLLYSPPSPSMVPSAQVDCVPLAFPPQPTPSCHSRKPSQSKHLYPLLLFTSSALHHRAFPSAETGPCCLTDPDSAGSKHAHFPPHSDTTSPGDYDLDEKYPRPAFHLSELEALFSMISEHSRVQKTRGSIKVIVVPTTRHIQGRTGLGLGIGWFSFVIFCASASQLKSNTY